MLRMVVIAISEKAVNSAKVEKYFSEKNEPFYAKKLKRAFEYHTNLCVIKLC